MHVRSIMSWRLGNSTRNYAYSIQINLLSDTVSACIQKLFARN